MAREDDVIRAMAQALKFPMEALVSSMETFVTTMRQVQELYNASVNAAVDGIQRAAPAIGGGTAVQPSAGADALQDLVRDTLNGLVVFVVPGPDAYSVAQGMSTPEPGGIEAGVTDVLIRVFDLAQPAPPQGPPASVAVAGLLNQVAQQINPAAAGSFASPFARLSFAEKVAVFAFLEQDPSMVQFRRLAGLLIFLPTSLAYSEAGVFDFDARTLRGWPVGWTISNYSGVADGRDELRGYFQGRREPGPSGLAHGAAGGGRRRRGA